LLRCLQVINNPLDIRKECVWAYSIVKWALTIDMWAYSIVKWALTIYKSVILYNGLICDIAYFGSCGYSC
jgi:hypothetical protein